MALLATLGVDKDPLEGLDEAYAVRSWPLPGQRPRPVKVREAGAPDWWESDSDASSSFLQAMGINLQ